ncbi:copper amine oxidase N-terminal domain-containing protein [Bacillus chungangensis]|uniref:Copper amine oxidase-like N-terminal domain-containing protein n=1 Tax=Bacillus chungangensis TaxID=587633 RepID=A0ABT9WTM5_9BACI|nr:copper amine oxidase N-terminal domain-containing protein [Bacillus chungangensis]MDQ0176464.1 hypothetical protein [Bacillus chungangensis]
MLQRKLKYIALSFLFALVISGKTANAAEDFFFWSDVVPVPSCYNSPDGSPKEMGVIKDGKKIIIDALPCEEAIKNRVLVFVNGKYLHTYVDTHGADPFIENGRTMIPLRAIADVFGFDVKWDEKEGKITLTKDGKIIILHIGKPEILVDGKTVSFEGAVPMVKNGYTFLPVRQLAEILEIKVNWDGDKRLATFTDKE